jgi:hypothetical protein
MASLRKRDPKGRWRSFKRHSVLLAETFFISALTTYVWRVVWIRGCHFPEDDNDVIIGAIIMTFGVMYGIALSWIMNRIWDVYQKIVLAVLKRDKYTFLLYRDERMPIAFHLIIGAVSIPLLGMIGAIGYKHLLTGEISVFSISFVLILSWFVASQIESPTGHGWFVERIPADWFTADVDEFFGLGPGHEGKECEATKYLKLHHRD